MNLRPKHIEMYAVSKKDSLVWSGSALSVLKFYKVIIFVGVLCYFWVVVKIYCRSSMFTYSLVFLKFSIGLTVVDQAQLSQLILKKMSLVLSFSNLSFGR